MATSENIFCYGDVHGSGPGEKKNLSTRTLGNQPTWEERTKCEKVFGLFGKVGPVFRARTL